jgi:nucleoid DNA-binding protein
MNKEKISSQEIIDLVASKASVSKRAAEEFLKVMIASVEEGLLAGEVVKIKNFGTFKLQWNEPRKSVNIQTGEEILITGYYKVVFIPDSVLKEQVNEPFAHLEPVELDTIPQKNEIIDEADEALDPLRIFTEQATEIKNLLSEIQAISPNPISTIPESQQPAETKQEEETIHEVQPAETKQEEDAIQAIQPPETIQDVQPSENKQELETIQDVRTTENIQEKETIQDDQPSEIIQEDKIKPKVVENVQIPDEKQPEENLKNSDDKKTNEPVILQEPLEKIIEKEVEINPIPSEKTESQLFSDLPVTPYLENVNRTKKSKTWLWIVLVLFIVSGLGTGIYLFYKPTNELTKITENISITEILNTVSGWFSSKPKPKPTPVAVKVVIPKDTNEYDSISQHQPVDSTQLLFDNPRVFNDFIASERMKAGTRLTIISKRYYGSKDFWVYIYEANKERISNPDHIAIGTLIRIPKLDPRLIDVTNPRCLEKAKQLHDIYVK